MTCANCGMPAKGGLCKTCELTREMEELQKARKATEEGDE